MERLIEKTIQTTTTLTTSEDGAHTYSFSKQIENIQGKQGIFILLYPTRDVDNCHVEDHTNLHILNHMIELGLNSYTVINLFSRVTKSRLSTRGLTIDKENLHFIQEEIFGNINTENTQVIIACGNTNPTSYAVNRSKQHVLETWNRSQPGQGLYQLCTNGVPKDSIGTHPLFLGIRHGNSAWRLETYPQQAELSRLKKMTTEKQPGSQADKKTAKASNRSTAKTPKKK